MPSTGKKHFSCFAFTLNSVGERALEETGDSKIIIQKVKDIVFWFRRSAVASDDLRKQ